MFFYFFSFRHTSPSTPCRRSCFWWISTATPSSRGLWRRRSSCGGIQWSLCWRGSTMGTKNLFGERLVGWRCRRGWKFVSLFGSEFSALHYTDAFLSWELESHRFSTFCQVIALEKYFVLLCDVPKCDFWCDCEIKLLLAISNSF